MVASFWHYVWRGNGECVVRSYEERGELAKYARIGAFMWYETLLIPFVFSGILILSQKLIGWPLHP